MRRRHSCVARCHQQHMLYAGDKLPFAAWKKATSIWSDVQRLEATVRPFTLTQSAIQVSRSAKSNLNRRRPMDTTDEESFDERPRGIAGKDCI